MDGPLRYLGLTAPLIAAPMAGGPSTPAMVVAAARVGCLGVPRRRLQERRAARRRDRHEHPGARREPLRPTPAPRRRRRLPPQGTGAGGHSATLTPAHPGQPILLADLVTEVAGETGLPVVAAGGLATGADVTEVLHSGAVGAMVGTLLVRTDESGASATYKAALGTAGDVPTVVTRAFTGRPARALANLFTDRYDALAPLGYPALHHLTSPLRRAAAAAGDPVRVNLWAGTGHRHAREGSAADVLVELAAGL